MTALTEEQVAVAPDPTAPHPAREAEAGDTHSYLLACVSRLPDAQREVVRLKFQQQMSYQEIAEVTGKTVNTVGVLLHTAMHSLRRVLSENPELGRETGGETNR